MKSETAVGFQGPTAALTKYHSVKGRGDVATDNSNTTPEELKELLQRFTEYCYARCGLAHATVGMLTGLVRRAVAVIGMRPSHAEVEKYYTDLRKSGISFASIANNVTALNRFMAFLDNPIQLKRPKKPRQVIVGVLSEAEIAVTIAAAKNLRERAMLELLAYSGIRNREFCGLCIRDVDVANNLLSVAVAKGELHRNICVAAAGMQTLSEYLKQRGGAPEEKLFVTVRNGNPLQPQDLRKIVRLTAKRAGIKKRVHPHLFRHSLATNMLHRGAGLFTIKEQLGHENIAATLLYIHCSKEKLRADYRAYVPSYT